MFNQLTWNQTMMKFTKQTEEFIASFIRDIVLYNMKNDAQFQIRRNVKMAALIEKITDTETLYTVFERC